MLRFLLAMSMLLGLVGVTALPAQEAAAESSGADTYLQGDNTFYAYLDAGENLDVVFTKAVERPLQNPLDIVVTDPTGAQQTCSFAGTEPVGDDCTFTNLTSTTAGIWEVHFDAGAVNGNKDMYSWDVQVQDGATDVPGRVWSERYSIVNPTGTEVDITLYYVSSTGFQYQGTYTDYSGVNSVFVSDSVGNTYDGTCRSAYRSYDMNTPETDPPNFPSGDEAKYDSPAFDVQVDDCGDPYKIFFEEPATDLPESAALPDGSTTWVVPALELPDVTDLTFSPDGASDRSGTFTADVDNFTGQLMVEIDANGDGDYTDAVDRQLPMAVVNGTGTVNFDGDDGQGNPISPDSDINARAVITQAGEIHFVNADVEQRAGGIEVTALNGPDQGSTTLYWDDVTELETAGRLCETPERDGTGGVDSAGGVHGWTCFSNVNNGINGSWGDSRYIDDWTYHIIDEQFEIEIPGADPQLELDKTSDGSADTRIGDTVEYTITVTNTGSSDYTVDDPARIQDSLEGVLDDATYNDDAVASTGTVTYEEPRLTWSGPLAAGDSVTITYTVTIVGNGDGLVDNVVFQTDCPDDEPDCDPTVPAVEECVDGGTDPETGLPCDTEHLRYPDLDIDKEADTTELPAVGDTVTYTVTATNVGTGDYTENRPAPVIDDLTDVLDDATLDEASLTADVGDPPTFTDPKITWSGPLAAGDSVTITYQVTYTGEGDDRMINVAYGPQCPADDPECDNGTPECNPADENGNDPVTGEPCDRVTIPGSILEVEKSADPEDGSTVAAGQEVTYTITFESLGDLPAEVDNWTDYIDGVLDDAEIIEGPTASNDDLTVSEVNEGAFTVNGTVPGHETYTVTYTVRVLPDGERGDHQLGNVVVPDGEEPGEECAAEDPLCTTHFVPQIVDSKSVDPEDGSTVQPGQELTYTLTFINEGRGAGSVDKVDDLTHVLDDATITSQPTASDPALTVSAVEDNRYSITGELAPDQQVTVTYTVTVNDAADLGDAELANFLLPSDSDPPGDPSDCEADDPDCTYNPVPMIVDSKSVDPETGSSVKPGQELTYTLTFSNVGASSAAVDRVDDLSHVLDDAEVTSAPQASADSLTVSGVEDGRFSITGELEPGETVTVSYTVAVNSAANLGDSQLANFILDPDDPAPEEPVCDGGEDCTYNPVSDVTVAKAANPQTGTALNDGQQVTYELTFTNDGAASGAVDYTDHLVGVLDDADLVGGPDASDGALSASRDGDRLLITGELAAGQTVTVSYQVKVKEYAAQGDHELGNFVTQTGQEPPTECAPDSSLCTVHPTAEGADDEPGGEGDGDLGDTGSPAALAPIVALGLLLIGGGGAFLVRGLRRRRAGLPFTGVDQ